MSHSGSRPKLKTAFKNARTIAPLHTSGPVALTPDGSKILTCVGEEVLFTEVATGIEICRFAGDTQDITSFAVSPNSSHLAVFTSSQSLRVYALPQDATPLPKPVQPRRVVARAHDAPVHVCKIDPTSTYLASGSADGVVKVWNLLLGFVTHVFRGHGGVVSALAFNYPQDASSISNNPKMELITASVDTRIRIFNLTASAAGGTKPQAVLEGHVSVPRALDVSRDGNWLVSGGRDSAILLWDLSTRTVVPKRSEKGKDKLTAPKLVKTIPALDRVEAVGIVQEEDTYPGSSSAVGKLKVYSGGEHGYIKVWDVLEGNVLYTLGMTHTDGQEQRQIVDILYVPSTSTLVSVHADQNILFHSLSTKTLTRQLIGYNDEIVDAAFLSSEQHKDSHIALATNSSLIRVYSTSTYDARLLEGHSDIVLTLDRTSDKRLLASGSKDRSARIWAPVAPRGSLEWGYGCVAVLEGHAESIGAIALSRISPKDQEQNRPGFIFTGSQDKTIKMWDMSGMPQSWDESTEPVRIRSLATHKAHDKDINSLDVSPNDKLLVSGSQDRTAKVYEIEYSPGTNNRAARGELKLIGVCQGHKRGVWCVRFGREERVLASGSGDKTIKLWSLDDFSCVKTFEGHTNSVLRVDFINLGMQLVSTASDGLVKLWNVREEECVATMDNHEDKVWALAVDSDESTIVSGAADSSLTFWVDCTEEQEERKGRERAELALKEQDFLNYVALHDYRRAIQLALAMEQPGRLLSLFKELQKGGRSGPITEHSPLKDVIMTMEGPSLAKMLQYIRDWNTSAKTSTTAQWLLYTIVKLRPADDLLRVSQAVSTDAMHLNEGKPGTGTTALKELVNAFIPYTERHLARLDRLVQDSYVVDYILGEMDDGMFDGDETESMEVDTAIGPWAQ